MTSWKRVVPIGIVLALTGAFQSSPAHAAKSLPAEAAQHSNSLPPAGATDREGGPSYRQIYDTVIGWMKSHNAYVTKPEVERALGIHLSPDAPSPNQVAFKYSSGGDRNITIYLFEEKAGYGMLGRRSGPGSELLIWLPNAGSHGPADCIPFDQPSIELANSGWTFVPGMIFSGGSMEFQRDKDSVAFSWNERRKWSAPTNCISQIYVGGALPVIGSRQ